MQSLMAPTLKVGHCNASCKSFTPQTSSAPIIHSQYGHFMDILLFTALTLRHFLYCSDATEIVKDLHLEKENSDRAASNTKYILKNWNDVYSENIFQACRLNIAYIPNCGHEQHWC
jgi:hypothetical protein